VTVAAIQQIVALITEDGVVAAPTGQVVVVRCAMNDVVPVGADDDVSDPVASWAPSAAAGLLPPRPSSSDGGPPRANVTLMPAAGAALLANAAGLAPGGISVPSAPPPVVAVGVPVAPAATGSKISPLVDAADCPASSL
jgi:hypothetical protein